MNEKQKTIAKEFSLSGRGLHTGNFVTMTVKPAVENHGIVFIRVDLPEKTQIKVGVETIRLDSGVPRCTTIGIGQVFIHTVEHLMSTLCGLEIDNVTIEIDGNEVPLLDGSGLEFLHAIKKVGVVEQNALREWIIIREPIVVNHKDASITVVPDEEYKVSYLLDYKHPFLGTQFFSMIVNSTNFEKELAPCRTFCLEEEAAELRKHNLGLGANYENTLVINDKGVINNQLRFADEFSRHKALDFVGDLYLLGKPIRGSVSAIKSGHNLNLALLKKIHQQYVNYAKQSFISNTTFCDKTELDVSQIMKILPHRYPFLFLDRIVHLDRGKKVIGIKNVTINDNFFEGHFPTRPIMPGVLMVEALAQAAGILMLTNQDHHGKVALFMAVDKVKFRKLVVPGEQLHLEVEMVRDRSRTAQLKGVARVGDEIAVEAEMMFSFIDGQFLLQG
ncbi:MAG: bifunctional UDP-3-O-[3-hydroxymyristoyl] N-acetylglucosamine deacetylase/3-hydroxyacyl-ACP dehydratase [Candidatus Omnitrophica bacterium]|nr:bifunctional UDP-3-O-[3-hydroxymyristoyl] N-acetylglucosamine deacetylase/3-hydroxyacyl-ACP dehydratase [Candidatus Omnitrophota bacterium]